MIASDAAARILDRLTQVLAPPRGSLTALEVDGAVAGWLTADRARRLAAFGDCFRFDGRRLTFAPDLHDCAARTAAVARVAAELAAEGALTAWRDERYAVGPEFGAAPWFLLERAAARYFGIHTYAAHVNGLVRDDARVSMWLARRSPTKAIDPGLLDNLVGGGIAANGTVTETVIREAWEEAGITADLAAAARPQGTLALLREQPDGIQRETVYVHDLWLPPDFIPANQDGEAVAHRLVPLPETAALLALDSGPDAVTADASLVAVDCLLRLRALDPSGAPHEALEALRDGARTLASLEATRPRAPSRPD